MIYFEKRRKKSIKKWKEIAFIRAGRRPAIVFENPARGLSAVAEKEEEEIITVIMGQWQDFCWRLPATPTTLYPQQRRLERRK